MAHSRCQQHHKKCCKKCEKKCESKEIQQVPSTLTSSLQVPEIATFVANGGILAQTNVQLSADGGLLYTVYQFLPAAGTSAAGLYSNSNGNLGLLSSISPDPFSSPNGLVESGAASSDFTFFSAIDDDGSTNVRVRVFGAGNFSSALYSVTFSDYSQGSGSGNGGWFTEDNAYLLFNYISTVDGPILKVLSMSPGLPTVAFISVPGFAFGPKPSTILGTTYLALGYSTVANFSNPVPHPPFGVNFYKFDSVTLSLTLVASSPTLYNVPYTSTTVLCNGVTIRLAVGLPQFSSFLPSTVYPSIPVSHLPPGTNFTDTNNLQIYDFNSVKGTIKQVYHTTVSGRVQPPVWVPTSEGKVLGLFQGVKATLNPQTAQTNVGTSTLSWMVFETCDKSGTHSKNSIKSSRVVGPIQLASLGVYTAISDNGKWLSLGANVQTQLGATLVPNYGFPTTLGLTSATGFNNLLLYNIKY